MLYPTIAIYDMFVKGFPGFSLPCLFRTSLYATSIRCHGQRESFPVAPAIWSFTFKILTKILLFFFFLNREAENKLPK